MGVTATDYREMLRRLLPDGPAWPQEAGELAMRIIGALAESYLAAHLDAERLHEEADPHNTDALLEDWERNFGLPDACVDASQSPEQRRNALVARVTAQGNPSRAYFIDLARTMGFTVTVTENRPLRCGIGACGDRLCSRELSFVWSVHEVSDGTLQVVDMGAVRDARAALECIVNRYKPAHTEVRFHYVDFMMTEGQTAFIATEDGVPIAAEDSWI